MIEVLHEDNHLLAVNKPAGLLTQPSGTDLDNLEDQSKRWIKSEYNKPRNVYLHAVHRLDRPVSGVVLFARTSKALSRLQEAMRNKQCQKTYFATVTGNPKNEEHLEHYLVHKSHHSKVVQNQVEGAKLAILDYLLIEQKNGQSLLEIDLKTGRYHQIRAQLAAIGCPIIGDHKYGSPEKFKSGTIALHHQKLVIQHPVKGRVDDIRSKSSQLFRSLIRNSWAFSSEMI